MEETVIKPIKSSRLLIFSDPQKACNCYMQIVNDLFSNPVGTSDLLSNKIMVSIKHHINYEYIDPQATRSAIQIVVYRSAESDRYDVPQEIIEYFKPYIMNITDEKG